MRLIDADELYKDICDSIDQMTNIGVPVDGEYLWGKLKDALDNTPTIDPKRGEWIDMGDFEQCSVCKGTHLKEFQSYYGKTTWIKTPYCPYCGADMRGKDDE